MLSVKKRTFNVSRGKNSRKNFTAYNRNLDINV
jgi:hypothetical protein